MPLGELRPIQPRLHPKSLRNLAWSATHLSNSSLMPVSESTSSSRPRVGGAIVRKAKLPDAVNIFELVNSLSGDGTLLRRSYAEICENVRDFTVAESESGVFLGCGALHLYGPASRRGSLDRRQARGQGTGRRRQGCSALSWKRPRIRA